MEYPGQKTHPRSRFKMLRWVVLGITLCVMASIIFRGRFSSRAPKTSRPKWTTVAQLPAPQFSLPGGVYTNTIAVRLTASPPTAVIRYTLDGTEPDLSSRKYTGPIRIENSTLLTARSFEGESSNSLAISRTYIRLSPELEGFSSNLPLVIFNSFGQKIPHDTKVLVSAHFVDAKQGRSTLAGPADFDGHGELNVRGHTSLRYPKHSYHFKTKDDAHDSLKVSLLGFPKDSDWVLYAPYPDKTLMRDVLGYELSNQIGRYASRTRFVEVFLNHNGGRLSQRDYLGVYVFEERIKRAKHRVNIEKLGPDDNSEPNVSGGYIFKKDHLDTIEFHDSDGVGYPTGGSRRGFSRGGRLFSGRGGFPADPAGFQTPEGRLPQGGDGFFSRWTERFGNGESFTSSRGNQFFYVEPKSDEITSKQKAWLTSYLNRFENVLYGENFKDRKTGYAAYIEPGSFIDHHLLVEVTKNIDGFRFSTFFYKDRGGKLNMGPIWDWNLSFGNANGKQGWMTDGWYWPQLDDQQYSWFRRLFDDPDFAQKYVDRWGELRTNQFAIAKIHARIDELAGLLEEAQSRNFRRWPILGRFIWPNTFVGQSFSEEVNWMKQWIQQRIEWIDRQFLAAPSLARSPGAIERSAEMILRAPIGTIYYTLDGTDPRDPGGAVSPKARLYNAPVTLNQDTVLFCRVRQDDRWSYPAVAKFTLKAPVF